MFGNFLRKSSDRKASTRTYSSASDTVDESSGVDTGSDTGNKKKSSVSLSLA